MSNEQSIRDELAEAMIGVKSADGRAWFIFGDDEEDRADTLVLADAILTSPVIRRIQAEALREARDEIMPPYNFELRPDGSEDRSLALVASVYGDVHRELSDVADRIEQNSEGNET